MFSVLGVFYAWCFRCLEFSVHGIWFLVLGVFGPWWFTCLVFSVLGVFSAWCVVFCLFFFSELDFFGGWFLIFFTTPSNSLEQFFMEISILCVFYHECNKYNHFKNVKTQSKNITKCACMLKLLLKSVNSLVFRMAYKKTTNRDWWKKVFCKTNFLRPGRHEMDFYNDST